MAIVAVDTWYPCRYTWRSAKGHTSRIDYVLHDAFRVEEVTTCGIAHTVDLACGAAEDHRCVKCPSEVKGGTDIENNRSKKKNQHRHIIDSKSVLVGSVSKKTVGVCPEAWKQRFSPCRGTIQNPFLWVQFQRRLWAFAPKPGNSVSHHAEELSGILLKHARDVFGVKGLKTSSAVDITWHLVHSESHCTSAATCEPSRGARMKCHFAAWMASKPCEFAPDDHLQGPAWGWKAYRAHQEWTRKAARSFFASALWVQADRLKRMVKPAIIADKLALRRHSGWRATETLTACIASCERVSRENAKWSRFAKLHARRHPDQRRRGT